MYTTVVARDSSKKRPKLRHACFRCDPCRSPLKVAVLLSGGVDSSCALHLLKKAGHHVTAFYLQIWFQEDFRNYWDRCPWEDDLDYCQQVQPTWLTSRAYARSFTLCLLLQHCRHHNWTESYVWPTTCAMLHQLVQATSFCMLSMAGGLTFLQGPSALHHCTFG